MKTFILSLVGVLSLAPTLLASPPASSEATVLSSYRLHPESDAVMQLVADLFEVEGRQGESFEVIVPADRAETLRALVPDAELIRADISTEIEEALAQNAFSTAAYRDFNAVQETMKKLAADHPDLVELISYGTSEKGLPLLALKISDNVKVDEGEPQLMLTAATHGDELITTEVLLGLIDEMIEGYGKDSRFTAMIDRHELYFIPVLNPDGFTRHQRYDNGSDPNRSYPWPKDPEAKPTASIAGVMSFFSSHNIVGSMDFHANAGMIMYPWAYTRDPMENAADRSTMDDLTTRMAATNGYEHGPIATTIYIAKGSSCDYYYWKKHTLAVAVEISDSKVPPAEKIPHYVHEMAEATWLFIEHFD